MNDKIELRKIIYKYAFWMSILIGIMGVIFCYYQGSKSIDKFYQDLYYSVASNLLSSIIFAIIFGYLANEALLNLFKEENSKQSEQLSQDIVKNLQNINTSFSPSSLYFPTKSVDTKFNKDLSLDLKNSTFYLFRGVSAKYVPIRIKNTTNNLSSVKVIILNPLEEVSLTLRAKDRQKNPKYNGKPINDLKLEIKNEIYRCIIDLFDARVRCPIEICFVEETSVIRLEIFDNALYLALYHTPDATSNSFPETFRYDKSSTYYNMFRLDSFRQIDEISKNTVKFDVRSNDNDLTNVLTTYGMVNLTPQALQQIRQENKLFSDNFVKESQIEKY